MIERTTLDLDRDYRECRVCDGTGSTREDSDAYDCPACLGERYARYCCSCRDEQSMPDPLRSRSHHAYQRAVYELRLTIDPHT